MPIDTSIIGRIKPVDIQQEDPIAQYAKGLQLKQLMTQQKLQDATMADDAAQREAFKESGGDMNRFKELLLGRGNFKGYQTIQKQQADSEIAAADLANKKAATQKTLTDVQASKLAQHRDLLSNVNDPQAAMAWVQEAGKSGLYPDSILQSAMSALQSAQTPEAFNSWKQQAALGATKYIEQNKPTYQTRDLGGTTQTLALPGLGGAPTIASTATKTATPGDLLSAQNAAAGRATQLRIAQMADDRSRDANTIKMGEKKATDDLTKGSQLASFDTMLGTLDRLKQHPGLSKTVGLRSVLPTIPGSDSANFQAELNTFQSQAFIPMVAQLKGMGALSDAEGKKLTQAVGALDPKMGEKAFRESIDRVVTDMEKAYSRVAGKPRAGASGSWEESKTKTGANVSNW